MDKRKIREIMPLLARLKKAFKPARVILFGSRSRGEERKESDYDLLIISSFFEGMRFYDRLIIAYSLRKDIQVSVDMICLTPGELESRKNEISVVGVALREGIEIGV